MFIFSISQASAQDCPDYYRFVDFGLEDSEGITYRGGIVLRAEGFDGQPLLLTEHTKCRAVRDVSKDGHGNPIPVVTSVNYDPAKTGANIEILKVSHVDDAEMSAEESASDHQTRLERSDASSTRGSDFLCVNIDGQQDLSCQLVSPYAGNKPLVVYCIPTKCTMPSLAINKRLQVSAIWPSEEGLLNDPDAAGMEFSDRLQKIHDFLKPLSAAQ